MGLKSMIKSLWNKNEKKRQDLDRTFIERNLRWYIIIAPIIVISALLIINIFIPIGLISTAGFAGAIIFAEAIVAFKYLDAKSNKNGLGMSRSKLKELGQATWLEESKLNRICNFKKNAKTLPNYDSPLIKFRWSETPEMELYGVVSSISSDKDPIITMTNKIHGMIIGSTGSGKSQSLAKISPIVLSRSKNKPSMVITDPKGEIFEATSRELEKQGYKIFQLDLQGIKKSDTWNPLRLSHFYNEQSQKCLANIKEFKEQMSEIPKYLTGGCELEEQLFGLSKRSKKYSELEKMVYTKEYLEWALKILNEELESEAFIIKCETLIDELANSIFIVSEHADAYWIDSAKDIFIGLANGMLEEHNINKTFPPDKFNLTNIAMWANEDPKHILKFFSRFKKNAIAYQKIKQLDGPEKTVGSILGSFKTCMGIFTSGPLKKIMCSNTIDIINVPNVPTAIFLKIPDDKVAYQKVPSMFIDQLYQYLVDITGKEENKKARIERGFLVIGDEWGNMPKVNSFLSSMTMGRSRRIFYFPMLQSYKQLSMKYGNDESEIIQDNMGAIQYLKSNNKKTIDTFAKSLGYYTVEKKSISENDKGESSSTSLDKVQLCTPESLESLPMFTQIVKTDLNPYKFKTTPYFKLQELELFEDGIMKAQNRIESFDFDKHSVTLVDATRIAMGFNERETRSKEERRKFTIPNDIDEISPTIFPKMEDLEIKNLEAAFDESVVAKNIDTADIILGDILLDTKFHKMWCETSMLPSSQTKKKNLKTLKSFVLKEIEEEHVEKTRAAFDKLINHIREEGDFDGK